MITENDKTVIIRCAEKYRVSSVIMFGSSVDASKVAYDIDLGVTGLEPRQFFKFYAELFKNLSKPVDLIDLTQQTLFNNLVVESGIRIYG